MELEGDQIIYTYVKMITEADLDSLNDESEKNTVWKFINNNSIHVGDEVKVFGNDEKYFIGQPILGSTRAIMLPKKFFQTHFREESVIRGELPEQKEKFPVVYEKPYFLHGIAKSTNPKVIEAYDLDDLKMKIEEETKKNIFIINTVPTDKGTDVYYFYKIRESDTGSASPLDKKLRPNRRPLPTQIRSLTDSRTTVLHQSSSLDSELLEHPPIMRRVARGKNTIRKYKMKKNAHTKKSIKLKRKISKTKKR